MRLTAIDLNEGDIVWQVPIGDGPRDHPALTGLDLPRLGTYPVAGIAAGWPLVTKTLVFVLQAVMDEGADGTQRGGPAHGVLFAYDKKTGELVSEMTIPRAPGGAPMTYVAGDRQFLVVPVGQRGEDHEYVAYALPAG